MIDSHTHLGLCAQALETEESELVAEAVRAGVDRMLTVGIDGCSSRSALATAEAFPQVLAAVGRHPNEAHGFDEEDLAELRALAGSEHCAAIGETGLDFYRQGAPAADQERAFCAQIELARELDKPLVIHTRAAEQRTIELLRAEARGLRVIMHCFSMPERIAECVEEGWWISFAGNVTYPSARELARVVPQVPLDRLLVETDAPYLPPQSHRGRRNRPALVTETAAFLAAARGLAPAELDAVLSESFAALFQAQ